MFVEIGFLAGFCRVLIEAPLAAGVAFRIGAARVLEDAVPARVKTYLESLLVYQLLARPGAEFMQRHPHAWLVWEPGAWAPPPALSDSQATRLPSELPQGPAVGDALCFELDPDAQPLALGRAPENALVINDATVSRVHLVLTRFDAGWRVEAVPGARESQLNGARLEAPSRLPLAPGARLSVGHVELTFHDAAGFMQRVRLASERLRRPAAS